MRQVNLQKSEEKSGDEQSFWAALNPAAREALRSLKVAGKRANLALSEQIGISIGVGGERPVTHKGPLSHDS